MPTNQPCRGQMFKLGSSASLSSETIQRVEQSLGNNQYVVVDEVGHRWVVIPNNSGNVRFPWVSTRML